MGSWKPVIIYDLFFLLVKQETKCILLTRLPFFLQDARLSGKRAGRAVLVQVPASFSAWLVLPGYT